MTAKEFLEEVIFKSEKYTGFSGQIQMLEEFAKQYNEKECEWTLNSGLLVSPHSHNHMYLINLQNAPYCNECGGKIKVIE